MTTSSQTLPQHLSEALANIPGDASGVLARVRKQVAVWLCEMHGHAPHLYMDRERLYLYCPTCRLESPGWSLEGPAPRPRQAGAPDRYSRYSWLTASSALQSRAESGDLVLY
jgi:hypothetical protein